MIVYHIAWIHARHDTRLTSKIYVVGISVITANSVLNSILYYYSNDQIRDRVLTVIRYLAPLKERHPIQRSISSRSHYKVQLQAPQQRFTSMLPQARSPPRPSHSLLATPSPLDVEPSPSSFVFPSPPLIARDPFDEYEDMTSFSALPLPTTPFSQGITSSLWLCLHLKLQSTYTLTYPFLSLLVSIDTYLYSLFLLT